MPAVLKLTPFTIVLPAVMLPVVEIVLLPKFASNVVTLLLPYELVIPVS